MQNKELVRFYAFFLGLYIAFTIRSYLQHATWFYDGLFSIAYASLFYYFSGNMKIKRLEYVLINLAVMTHLLGFFGFYAWGTKYFQYDNVVHLVGGTIAAYIIFNFFAKTFESNKELRKLFNKHKFFLFFLIISVACTLGLFIEMMEYGGYLFLGNGDGLFFVGSGDANGPSIYGNYLDTMDDITTNIVGALLGSFIYYRFNKKLLS